MSYFRRYYEAADDSGAADATDAAIVEDVATDADVPEVEPEVYTREQLAELLGPRFERFASHEGEEAFRQFGTAYDNATGLIRQGGHLTRQEEDAYRAAGIDPSDVATPAYEEPEVEAMPIYGAPWEQPTSWDEYVSYAQSDSPEQRRVAAYGVLQSEADQPTKQWFFNQCAQADPHGASAYVQQSTLSAAEQRLAALEERLEAKYAATHEDLVNRNANDLMETVKAQVPGFVEHSQAVVALWNERVAAEPTFADRFLNAPRADQLREMRRLTIIAAAEAAPARQSAQAQAADATDAAKIRSRTETARSTSASDPAGDLKRQSLDEAKRVFGNVR